MKQKNLLSFSVSFIMFSGLSFFIFYVKHQESLLAKQHDSIMKELKEMKAEAQQLNSQASANNENNQIITKEKRQKISQAIEKCVDDGTCLFQLRGEATKDPTISFIVNDNIWYSFEEDSISVLRQMLKDKVKNASVNPSYYVSIPSNAAFYPIAIENVRNITSYSVILSHGLTSQGTLSIDETILKNF